MIFYKNLRNLFFDDKFTAWHYGPISEELYSFQKEVNWEKNLFENISCNENNDLKRKFIEKFGDFHLEKWEHFEQNFIKYRNFSVNELIEKSQSFSFWKEKYFSKLSNKIISNELMLESFIK